MNKYNYAYVCRVAIEHLHLQFFERQLLVSFLGIYIIYMNIKVVYIYMRIHSRIRIYIYIDNYTCIYKCGSKVLGITEYYARFNIFYACICSQDILMAEHI